MSPPPPPPNPPPNPPPIPAQTVAGWKFGLGLEVSGSLLDATLWADNALRGAGILDLSHPPHPEHPPPKPLRSRLSLSFWGLSHARTSMGMQNLGF